MKHKRLVKTILPFTLCIAIALGNITIVRAEQDLSGESNVNSQQSKQTDRTNQTDQTNQADQADQTNQADQTDRSGQTDQADQTNQADQTDRSGQTDQINQTDEEESTVIINGEEVPLSEGENITKNDNTGLLCVGLFAGVLVLAGAREFKIRKHIK